MLFKKELSEIPLLNPPKLEGRFLAASRTCELKKSGIVLVVDFFSGRSGELVARFFSDGKHFATCTEWPAQSWKESNPRSYTGYRNVEASKKDISLAWEFLKGDRFSKNSIIQCVDSFVSNIRYERRQKEEDTKTQLMKKHFGMFPELPENLPTFCENHIFDPYIFIGKVSKKGDRTGVCSFCGEEFAVERATRSGQHGVCPCCGKASTYRGTWIGSPIVNTDKICIAHNVDSQLLIRWTKIKRTFYPGEHTARYEFDDYAYNLHLKDGKKCKTYFYKYIVTPHFYGCYGWYKGRLGDYCYDSSYVYTDNLDEVFWERYYNVNLKAGLERFNCKGTVPFAVLLNNLKNVPAAEYLFKLGMISLASEAHRLPKPELPGRPGFSTLLGVSEQMKPVYSAANVSLAEHEVIKKYGQFVSLDMLEGFRKLKIPEYEARNVNGLLKSMSFSRFVHYFTKQKRLNPKRKIETIITWYRDYLDMSAGLGVDLSHKGIRFPKNCIEAHDQVLPRFNEKKCEVENAIFEAAVKSIYKGLPTVYAKNGYCIVLPQKRSDLITEGQSLNHCVGGDRYYRNHIEGTYMIFFVRRSDAPDKPFFTMEVDMGNYLIRQLYGFGDCSAPPEVRKFAEGYVATLKRGASKKAS